MNAKGEEKKQKYLTKVARYEILKPEMWVGGKRDGEVCEWKELGQVLRDVQYLEAKIANTAMTEAYMKFRSPKYKPRKMSEISRDIRKELLEAKKTEWTEERFNQYSEGGVLSSFVTDALKSNILGPQLSGENWKDVLKANSSLPTYKRNLPIVWRCDNASSKNRKVFLDEDGDHKVDLGLTRGSKIRIVLRTGKIDGSQKTILDKLIDPESDYSQRTLQISSKQRGGVGKTKWYLSVTFRFPESDREPNPDIIVGADVGFSCPLVAAVSNNKKARIGRREFGPITEQLRKLQSQTIARRRQIQRGGGDSFVKETSRGGHGRKRRLKPIERLQNKIDNAYKTLNHQISRRLVDFAVDHNAGVIQIENLDGMKDHLTGSFLGERWRYYELQEFIKYKAKEQNIKVVEVNPKYTSRRCHACGHVHLEFTSEYRQKNKPDKGVCQFKCPECEFEDDPDFNAAKNLAVKGVDKLIAKQVKKQDKKQESK